MNPVASSKNLNRFPIQLLPSETLYHIFTYLGPKNVGLSATVCRQWNLVSQESMLWKLFCTRLGIPFDEKEHPKETFKKQAGKLGQIKANLKHFHELKENKLLIDAIKKPENIKFIEDLSQGSLIKVLIDEIKKRYPNDITYSKNTSFLMIADFGKKTFLISNDGSNPSFAIRLKKQRQSSFLVLSHAGSSEEKCGYKAISIEYKIQLGYQQGLQKVTGEQLDLIRCTSMAFTGNKGHKPMVTFNFSEDYFEQLIKLIQSGQPDSFEFKKKNEEITINGIQVITNYNKSTFSYSFNN